MQGIFYAIFVVAILVIIRWYIENERLGSNLEGDKGWLAMRNPSSMRKPPRLAWKSRSERSDARQANDTTK